MERMLELQELQRNKLVCSEKYEHAELKRLKVRLVIFGNHQKKGLVIIKLFAPVGNMVAICTFQMNVHNAIQHGD